MPTRASPYVRSLGISARSRGGGIFSCDMLFSILSEYITIVFISYSTTFCYTVVYCSIRVLLSYIQAAELNRTWQLVGAGSRVPWPSMEISELFRFRV